MQTMELRTILFALVVLFIFSACNSSGPGDNIDRAYLYVANHPDSDTDAARGNLNLRFENTDEEGVVAQIAGTWEINKLNDGEELGPQTGEGKLRGKIREDGSVRIDLNPDIADQNVILTGSFPNNGDRSFFEGKWMYQTLSGSTSGEFEALQVGPLE